MFNQNFNLFFKISSKFCINQAASASGLFWKFWNSLVLKGSKVHCDPFSKGEIYMNSLDPFSKCQIYINSLKSIKNQLSNPMLKFQRNFMDAANETIEVKVLSSFQIWQFLLKANDLLKIIDLLTKYLRLIFSKGSQKQ